MIDSVEGVFAGLKSVFSLLNFSFVVGALGSYIFIRYRLVTSEKGAQINDHMKDIEKFGDAALSYWLKTNEKKEEDAERAARLRAMHGLLTKMYPEISSLCASRNNRYKQLMFSLFDDAMGGDFEGADRGVEYDRASRIGDCHADLILELRRLRRDVLTLRYVLRSMLPIGKKSS